MTVAAPCILVVTIVAGILVGEQLGPGGGEAELVLVAAALGGAAVVRRRRFVLVVVASLGLGMVLTERALDGLVHSPLAGLVARHADASVRVTLAEDPAATPFVARGLARVASVRSGASWRDAGGRTVLLVARGSAASRLGLLQAGDRVVLAGWFSELEGLERRYRWRHAVGRFAVTDFVSFAGPSGPLARFANALRGAIMRGTAVLPAPDGDLVDGFLLGDTRGVPTEVVADFRTAGLSHLLAVSGANVAFVLALADPLLRRLPRDGRLMCGVLVVVCFGAMTRWEPSVLRACAMAACAMTAVYLGRPAAGLRTLAIAAGALLLADPFLVHSVGFLLSCSATLGIVVAAPAIARWLPGPVWVRTPLSVTLAAQAGVLPVVVPVFGGLTLAALPANLVAVPLAEPLTVWGLASAVGGGALRAVPGLAFAVQAPTLLVTRIIRTVAHMAAHAPVAVSATELLVGGVVAAIWIGWRRTRRATWSGAAHRRVRELAVPAR